MASAGWAVGLPHQTMARVKQAAKAMAAGVTRRAFRHRSKHTLLANAETRIE